MGGESAFKPRPMDADWVIDIQEQCNKKDVAFFFKQWVVKVKRQMDEF
ncbi:phage Gp37/Gp68 family protein [Elizabethkingia bruuniana]|nr:phage Gp37/Gp68 family protein [Elizabethkingia bruuniana]